MQINLTGHHVDLTDSLRDYVESKLEKLERHFDQVASAFCLSFSTLKMTCTSTT